MRANFPLRETVMPSFKHKTTFVCWLIVIIIFVFFSCFLSKTIAAVVPHTTSDVKAMVMATMTYKQSGGQPSVYIMFVSLLYISLLWVVVAVCSDGHNFLGLFKFEFGISICFQLFSTDDDGCCLVTFFAFCFIFTSKVKHCGNPSPPGSLFTHSLSLPLENRIFWRVFHNCLILIFILFVFIEFLNKNNNKTFFVWFYKLLKLQYTL